MKLAIFARKPNSTDMLVHPCAKINLGLHIVERRTDGYHNIETVFYPIPLTDNLEVRPLHNSNEPYLLQVAGQTVSGAAKDNLVVRAYERLLPDFPHLPPIDIYLYKRIPAGAGLGGGSSDAAAMLCLLNEKFSLGMDSDELEQRAATLGADCAFFVRSIPTFATGIGEILTPMELSLKGWILTLVKPQESVSTAEAYANVTPQAHRPNLREILAQPVAEWRTSLQNDLEASVSLRHPIIPAIRDTLYDMGATYAAMSGSGSCVFALFTHRQPSLSDVFPDCFTFQARLLH